jgi:exodeoxyribonuclease VII large subunit
VDFTIADFVADMRAPTPSAAAEMVLRQRNVMSGQIGHLRDSLNNAMGLIFDKNAERFKVLKSSRSLLKPHLIYEDKIAYVDGLGERLNSNISRSLNLKFERLKNNAHKLNIVSPLSVLKRGFSICFDSNENVIKNAKEVKHGNIVNIKLADGSFNAEVKNYD